MSLRFLEVEEHLPNLSDEELDKLAGAIVAEFVIRGSDTDSAFDRVVAAARGGREGSQAFDRIEP